MLNLALFSVGLFFEIHPRDRHDRWSAAGVAAVAVLNSAALSLPPLRGLAGRLVQRVRRIALFANVLLVLFAVLAVGVVGAADPEMAAGHALGLVLPPLVTLGALHGRER
jgi:hypothetical protein